MPTTRGLVSFSADPDQLVAVDGAWARFHAAFGATDVRIPIVTAVDGSFPTALNARALDAYHGACLGTMLVATRQFQPVNPGVMFPNQALNTVGDPLSSPYIDAWTMRLMAVARQLVKHGGTRFTVANEPNLLPSLPLGVDAPPGEKSSAMHPHAFAALMWQAARRLRSVGVQEVYCGSLSILPFTGTDAHNPYYSAWVESFYAFLESHGHRAPWPWAGWSVNVEGSWSADTLKAHLGPLRAIMAKHGDTGTLICGEWGWANGNGVNPQTARTTYEAICSQFTEAYQFQGPGRLPYLGPWDGYHDYGDFSWRQNGHVFEATYDYSFGPILRALFATPQPAV